jgi:hypothetical protein
MAMLEKKKAGPLVAESGGGVMIPHDVKETISIDLDVAIESDINSWNEYLMELVAEPMLQNIGWKIVGLNEDGDVMLEVTGYVQEEG